jgi:hypothetical protein
MNNVVPVQILQTEQYAADEELDYILRKPVAPAQLKPQIPAGHVIHYKVKVEPILKSVDHIDDEGVLELCQQLPFVEDRFYAFLCDYAE